MPPSKKDVEFWRLEQFRRFCPDVPEGEVVPSEGPDFLIHGIRTIGIELTDLHRATPPGSVPQQASAAMRNRVIATAAEIYKSQNLPPVLATFFLDDREHVQKAEVYALAASYADLVAQNVPHVGSGTEVPSHWDDFRELPKGVHKARIRRLEGLTSTTFSNPGATWVATLSREDINRALQDKEKKLAAYKSRCDEVWLVINCDTESMSTWFEVAPELHDEIFDSDFDRLYLVQHFRRAAHRLRTSGTK